MRAPLYQSPNSQNVDETHEGRRVDARSGGELSLTEGAGRLPEMHERRPSGVRQTDGSKTPIQFAPPGTRQSNQADAEAKTR